VGVRPRSGQRLDRVFEDLWAAYVKADAAADADGAERALREIRRVLVERNVEGHETLRLGSWGAASSTSSAPSATRGGGLSQRHDDRTGAARRV